MAKIILNEMIKLHQPHEDTWNSFHKVLSKHGYETDSVKDHDAHKRVVDYHHPSGGSHWGELRIEKGKTMHFTHGTRNTQPFHSPSELDRHLSELHGAK